MFGAGVAGWVYYQTMRRVGDNPKAVWIVTLMAFASAYFVMYTLFAWVFKF